MKINNIKKKVQRYDLSNGFIINKPASTNELKSFIKRFNNKFKSVDLVRIGGQNDGGYLLPNILEEVDICFSPFRWATQSNERRVADQRIDARRDEPICRELSSHHERPRARSDCDGVHHIKT